MNEMYKNNNNKSFVFEAVGSKITFISIHFCSISIIHSLVNKL